jgi:hypothetical protein
MNIFRKSSYKYVASAAFVALAAVTAGALFAGQPQASGAKGGLVVYGDTVFFIGPGLPNNCTHSSRFKHGDNVGFRMTAINPDGERDRATQLVVHVTYAGKTVDIPMRDHENDKTPERKFWVAKWPVPADAPVGIVHYTVTAKDSKGRTGEFKPFRVDESEVTIVE